MKRLLLFFLLLSVLSSQAQTIQKINVYGYQYNRLVMDSAFGLPKDTFSVPVSYRHLPHISAKDTAIYIWSPALQKWRLASAGGSGGVATAWGQLTGPLSNQTDLQTALNAKQNTITLGTAAQYFRGNLTLGTFSTDVLAVTNPLYAPLSHGHNGLIPPGGLPGQILKKKSISDWDMDWYYEDTTASAVASVHGRTGAVTAQSGDYSAFYPSLTGYNKTNWDNAYSWGNHASAGYLTNITGKVAAGTNVTISGAGTTASPYTISSSGGGLGTVTYNANYNKVLVQDTTTGTFYRQSAAVLNLTSPQNGDLLKYLSGVWVNYTPSNTPYVQYNEIAFTGSSGQSTFTWDSISGKHVRVWREGALQKSSTTYGIGVSGATITFYPSLSSGESVYVEASTAAAWTTHAPAYTSSDADVTAFLARLSLTGATFTQTKADALTTFITTLKSNGLYTGIKELWLMVGGNAASHALGFKGVHDLTFNGGWTHTETGAKPNGTNAYAQTGVIPSTDLTLNNMNLSFWSRTNATSEGGDDIAVSNSATSIVRMYIRDAGGVNGYAEIGASAQRITSSPSNTLGLFSLNRTSSTQLTLYQNATSLGSNTSANTGSLPTSQLFISALNNPTDGTGNYSPRECAFASVGTGRSSGDESIFYNALATLQTALGR